VKSPNRFCFFIALRGHRRCRSKSYSERRLTSERHEQAWINLDAFSSLIVTSSFFVCSSAVRATRVLENSATIVAAISNLTDTI
jgi:hypothetical protein